MCFLIGKSRQAYYGYKKFTAKKLIQKDMILSKVLEYKQEMPNIGVRKLHYLLNVKCKIDVGRDYLFKLLNEEGLLVKRKKRKARTTDSNHRFKKYQDLTKDIRLSEAEELWVGDITYISTKDGFYYLSTLMDAYTKYILGYHLSKDLSSKGCEETLKMALANKLYNNETMHHTDRGMQYCCIDYVKILKRNKIKISMTENGSPYENAMAERLNETLKVELGLEHVFEAYNDSNKVVKEAIRIYNYRRPHLSCGYLTPREAHLQGFGLINLWKNRSNKGIHAFVHPCTS